MKVDLDAWAKEFSPKRGTAAPQPAPLTYADTAVANAALRLLTAKSAELSKALQSGSPPTVEAYREMVGELRGVNFAIEAVRGAEREVSGSDEAPEKEKRLYES